MLVYAAAAAPPLSLPSREKDKGADKDKVKDKGSDKNKDKGKDSHPVVVVSGSRSPKPVPPSTPTTTPISTSTPASAVGVKSTTPSETATGPRTGTGARTGTGTWPSRTGTGTGEGVRTESPPVTSAPSPASYSQEEQKAAKEVERGTGREVVSSQDPFFDAERAAFDAKVDPSQKPSQNIPVKTLVKIFQLNKI